MSTNHTTPLTNRERQAIWRKIHQHDRPKITPLKVEPWVVACLNHLKEIRSEVHNQSDAVSFLVAIYGPDNGGLVGKLPKGDNHQTPTLPAKNKKSIQLVLESNARAKLRAYSPEYPPAEMLESLVLRLIRMVGDRAVFNPDGKVPLPLSGLTILPADHYEQKTNGECRNKHEYRKMLRRKAKQAYLRRYSRSVGLAG